MLFEKLLLQNVRTHIILWELLQLQHQYSKNRMVSGKAVSFHIVRLCWFRCLEKEKAQLHYLWR